MPSDTWQLSGLEPLSPFCIMNYTGWDKILSSQPETMLWRLASLDLLEANVRRHHVWCLNKNNRTSAATCSFCRLCWCVPMLITKFLPSQSLIFLDLTPECGRLYSLLQSVSVPLLPPLGQCNSHPSSQNPQISRNPSSIPWRTRCFSLNLATPITARCESLKLHNNQSALLPTTKSHRYVGGILNAKLMTIFHCEQPFLWSTGLRKDLGDHQNSLPLPPSSSWTRSAFHFIHPGFLLP